MQNFQEIPQFVQNDSAKSAEEEVQERGLMKGKKKGRCILCGRDLRGDLEDPICPTHSRDELLDFKYKLHRQISRIEWKEENAPFKKWLQDPDNWKHYLNLLGPRDRLVFLLRHRDKLTFQKIGERLGLSRERARQLLSRAHRIIKKQKENNNGNKTRPN